MSLRRHINSDYFLSLFAGVRSATTAPPGTYNMDDPLGRGACGIGVGSNGAITPPTITAPVGLVEPDGSITASAFSATGGLTHRASRWFIEDCTGGAVGTPAQTLCPIATPDPHDPMLGHPYADDGLATGTWYCVPVSAGSPTWGYGWSIVRPASGWTGVTFPDGTYASATGNLDYPVGGGTAIVIPAVPGTDPTCGGGNLVYDSGATTAHKTSLPLVLAPLQPNRSYRIRVRYQASDGSCSGYSDWVPFIMSSTCLDCVALPPPPAPSPPPPAPPAPPPPPLADGFSALAIDLGASYIMGDSDACLGSPIMLPEIMARGGKRVGVAATVFLTIRNLTTAPITGTIRVSANNSDFGWMNKPSASFTPVINPLPYDIPITLPAGQVKQLPSFQLVTTAFASGLSNITIDTGSGIPTTFNLAGLGVNPCPGSPGDTGSSGDGGA